MHESLGKNGVLSFLLLVLLSGAAQAQTAEEKLAVGSRFIQSLFDPSYGAVFVSKCEIYGFDDILGDEFLIYLGDISPQESFFDKDLMDIVFVNVGERGLVVAEYPDYVEREAKELAVFANEEDLQQLTAPELDSVDVYFKEALEFFNDSCGS